MLEVLPAVPEAVSEVNEGPDSDSDSDDDDVEKEEEEVRE